MFLLRTRKLVLAAISVPLFLSVSAHAQDTILWKNYYSIPGDDQINATIQTRDGNFVSVGQTTSNSPSLNNVDLFLLKTDSLGRYIGSKIYGLGDTDVATSVCQDAQGNFYITGFTKSMGPTGQVLTAKLDENGNILWCQFAGNSAGESRASSVILSAEGGCYVTGYTTIVHAVTGTQVGAADAFVIKYDGNGNMLWGIPLGTIYNDFGTGLALSPDSGVVMSGVTWSGKTPSNGYAVRINKNGIKQWEKVYAGAAQDAFTCIAPVPGGGYVFGGNTGFDSISSNAFVCKIQENGAIVWARTTGNAFDFETYNAIKLAPGSGYVLCGKTILADSIDRDGLLMRISEDGTCSWEVAINCHPQSDEIIKSICPISTGYLLSGNTILNGSSDIGFALVSLDCPACGLQSQSKAASALVKNASVAQSAASAAGSQSYWGLTIPITYVQSDYPLSVEDVQ